MTSGSTWQELTSERIAELLRGSDRMRGLWLGGSLARGDADRLSDIDFVAAAGDGPLDEAAADVESVIAREFELVLTRRRGDAQFRLLNFVTYEWMRLDFSLFASAAIAGSGHRGLRRLFDKDGVGGAVEQPPAPGHPPAAREVGFALTEFARVLGLLPVVLHRGDLLGAVSGAFVLREQLVALFRYDQEDKPARGALNQTSTVSEAGAEVLLRLPAVEAERSSVLRFHQACLSAFLEYGPGVADRHQVEWPARLVEALLNRLAREFGAAFVQSA